METEGLYNSPSFPMNLHTAGQLARNGGSRQDILDRKKILYAVYAELITHTQDTFTTHKHSNSQITYATDTKLAKPNSLDEPAIIVEAGSCKPFGDHSSQCYPYIATNAITVLRYELGNGRA